MSRIKGLIITTVFVVIGGCKVMDEVPGANGLVVDRLLSLGDSDFRGMDAQATNGLVGESTKEEPFDSKYLGDWYDPGWEKVECKLTRLSDANRYSFTFVGTRDEEFHFTGAFVKVGELSLLDLTETATKDRATGRHLLFKVDRRFSSGYAFGKSYEKQAAVLGEGPKYVFKRLILSPLQGRYFLDHPGRLASQPIPDQTGHVLFTASTKELQEFLETHGADKGLWADESVSIQLNAKLNPDDPQTFAEAFKSAKVSK